MINFDDDIVFKDCTISIATNALFQGAENFSNNKTMQFENCKVYTCNSSYSFLADFRYESRHSLIVKNSRFENFVELFHVEDTRVVDIQDNVFAGFEEGLLLHFYNVGDEPEAGEEFTFKNNTVSTGRGLWFVNCENLDVINNTFLNCYTDAIRLENSTNISISETDFINCNKGIISTTPSTGGNFNIMKNNTFTDVEIAYDLKKVSKFTILNNTMSNPNVPGISFVKSTEGNFTFFRNIITDELSGSLKKAFDLGGIGQVYAFGNEYYAPKGSYFFNITSKSKVTMTNNISRGGRVYLGGMADLNIYGNEVDALNHKFSFYSALNPNSRFCNNSGKNASTVFSFRGNCMNTDFSNNDIGELFTTANGTGLFVDDVIGQQEHKANLWNASFSTEGATNTSPFAQLSLITVNNDSNQGGNSLFEPQNSSYSPSNWFIDDNSTTSFANCQSTNIINPNSDISFVDRAIIGDHYNITPLSNWLAVKNLIRKLITHPALLNDVDANNWWQNQQSTSPMAIGSAESLLDNYYGTPIEVRDIRILIKAYVQLTEQLEISTPGSSNYNNIIAQLIQVRSDINNIQQGIDSRQITIYNNLSTVIPSINPTNDYESIFKDIYTIYLEYLDDEDFIPSSVDLAVIDEAANLCPLSYGPSIYIAQSLATQYGIAYDEENCSETRIRKRQSNNESKSELVIYPNPATNQITVNHIDNMDVVKIYDMNMREVKRSTSLTINTSSLPRGIYFVECSFEKMIVATKKLILIK